MNPLRPTLAPLALALTLPALGAQQGFDSPRKVSFVGNHVPAAPLLLANLTDDGVPDAVTLTDGPPVVLYGGVQYRRRIDLGVSGVDVAVYPRVNADLTDGLLVASGGGVELWRWSAQGDQFDATPLFTSHGYRAVDIAPNALGIFQFIVAIDADGRSAESWIFWNAGTPVGQLATFPLDEEAHSVALFDADDDGVPELACAGASGLTIYELDGSAPPSTIGRMAGPSSGASDLLLPIDAHGGGQELAWVEVTGSQSVLRVLDPFSVESFQLGGLQPVAISSYGRPGEPQDLALSLTNAGDAILLHNRTGQSGPTYSTGAQDSTPLVVGGQAGNVGGIAFADFDNDGDPDVLIGDSVESRMIYFEGNVAQRLAPMLVLDTFNAPIVEGGFTAEFGVTDPQGGYPSDATAVEVRAWSRLEADGPLVLAPELPQILSPQAASDMTIQLDIPTHVSEQYGFVDVRAVRRVAGEPPKAYPGLLGVMTPEDPIYFAVADGPLANVLVGELALEMDDDDLNGGVEEILPAAIDDKGLLGGIIVDIGDIPLDET